MRKINSVGNVYRWCLAFSLLALESACQRSEFQSQSKTGFIDFSQSVERAYHRLAEDRIHKKDGFYNECSVEFFTETGIRVSESVCEEGDSALKVTIQITDPATRPPSQRQEHIAVLLGDLGRKNLIRGQSEEFPNGTTIEIDRTGQTAILTRKLLMSK
jgi:hypothetical protein